MRPPRQRNSSPAEDVGPPRTRMVDYGFGNADFGVSVVDVVLEDLAHHGFDTVQDLLELGVAVDLVVGGLVRPRRLPDVLLGPLRLALHLPDAIPDVREPGFGDRFGRLRQAHEELGLVLCSDVEQVNGLVAPRGCRGLLRLRSSSRDHHEQAHEHECAATAHTHLHQLGGWTGATRPREAATCVCSKHRDAGRPRACAEWPG